MADDEPAGRIAARVVVALPRRARIRAILCQLAGAAVAAVVAAGLVTPLAYAIGDGRDVDAAVLFLSPMIAATIALAERGRRR
jgi:hypothetical protein